MGHQFCRLAKLGFQEEDGIPATAWFTSKNMKYQEKDDNRQNVAGDPIYIL
jgi:hypothetical protein